MVTVIFWTRLRPEHAEEYAKTAAHIADLAQAMPGFLGMKTFAADDGERVTIAEFDSMETAVAWRQDPEHQEAQRLGRAHVRDSHSAGRRDPRFDSTAQ